MCGHARVLVELCHDLACRADDQRAARERLGDAGERAVALDVARDAEDAVLHAARPDDRAGPGRPAGRRDGRGVGGERKQHDLGALHGQQPCRLGQERVDADRDADAPERRVHDRRHAAAVVERHLEERDVHLAPGAEHPRGADEDVRVEEHAAGILEQTRADEQTGVTGRAPPVGGSRVRRAAAPSRARHEAPVAARRRGRRRGGSARSR